MFVVFGCDFVTWILFVYCWDSCYLCFRFGCGVCSRLVSAVLVSVISCWCLV